MKIKMRNLAPDIRNWVMQKTGVGPNIGKIKYLAEASSAIETFLLEEGISSSDIFHTLKSGEAALTTNRNDCLLVYPGTYTETETTTWSKSMTHLIGMGGPNQRTPAVTGTKGAVYFTSTTAGLTSLLSVSGHYNQISGIGMLLSCAAGVGTLSVTGRVNTFKDLYIRQGEHATQLASAVLGFAVVFPLTVAGHGNNNTFRDCHIGESRNVTMTAGGVIYFVSTGAAGNQQNEFKNCFIQQRSETEACAAVHIGASPSVDRHVLWEDCTFYNFAENLTPILTSVFSDSVTSTHMNLLTKGTCQYGWTDWGPGTYIFGSMPVPYATGGTMVTMT